MKPNSNTWYMPCILLITLSLSVLNCSIAYAEDIQTPEERNGLPLLFEDNFEAGHERWEMTDPEAWRIETDGERTVLSLSQQSEYTPPVRSPHNIAYVKDLRVGDFILETTLRYTGRAYGHADLCLFFGYQDPAHFYYVHRATEADPHANSIFLVNGEPRVSIAQERTDGTDWSDGYHKVRITRSLDSGLIQVFFDDMDNPIMTAEDSTLAYGSIGVGSFDDTGYFDAIRVYAKPDPAE